MAIQTKDPASFPLPAEIKIGREASLAGGRRAGEYLDNLGITDLAAMNEEQWTAFCVQLVSGALIHALSEVYSTQLPS